MTEQEWKASFNEADERFYNAYWNAFEISRDIVRLVVKLRDNTALDRETRNKLARQLGIACADYELWHNRVLDTDRRQLDACYMYGIGHHQSLSELLKWAAEYGEE